MTAFIAREGALAGQRFELEGERTIGREGADITLDDDQVSRRHARLSVSGDTIVIEDLGSTNGTFVNNRKIEAATVLAPGDTVRIGTNTFALEAEPEPEPEPLPAMPEPAVTVAREATPAAPPPAPEPEPVPAAPVAPAPVLTGTVGAPREPFGAYLAPETSRHGGGIQSRQRGPILVTYAIVLGVAIALAVYFAYV